MFMPNIFSHISKMSSFYYTPALSLVIMTRLLAYSRIIKQSDISSMGYTPAPLTLNSFATGFMKILNRVRLNGQPYMTIFLYYI